jgi:hypothetical protein
LTPGIALAAKQPIFDVVAEVLLVAQPGASLAEAHFAGISHTTPHKQYATRGELT